MHSLVAHLRSLLHLRHSHCLVAKLHNHPIASKSKDHVKIVLEKESDESHKANQVIASSPSLVHSLDAAMVLVHPPCY
jgi:hypothetical protein